MKATKEKITVKVRKEVEVKSLLVQAHVRYWEDAEINGESDEEGNMPFRNSEDWCPKIDLSTGKIEGWPGDIEADIHYKVCEEGTYTLLDEEGNAVKEIEGYVPDIMCPNGGGNGDCIIMKVGKDGQIADWKCILEEFED